jgi:hypothetical protein
VLLLSRYVTKTYLAQLGKYQYVFGTGNELDLRVSNSVAEAVDREVVGIPERAKPVPISTGEEHGASVAASAEVPAASASMIVITPASPTSPQAAAASTPSQAPAPTQEWWSLDMAKNYFPHTTQGQSLGSQIDLLSPPPPADEECADEEFKDSPELAEYLEKQAAEASAAAAQIGHTSTNSADPDAIPLLASPEDQALFDAALAREMNALSRDFQAQLHKQQENFSKRIGELESKGAAMGDVSSRNGGRISGRQVPVGRKWTTSLLKQRLYMFNCSKVCFGVDEHFAGTQGFATL